MLGIVQLVRMHVDGSINDFEPPSLQFQWCKLSFLHVEMEVLIGNDLEHVVQGFQVLLHVLVVDYQSVDVDQDSR